MSDMAWISLATIIVAFCVLAVVFLTRRNKDFYMRIPVPFLPESFVLSPGDKDGVIQEQLLRLQRDIFETFIEVTKRGDAIDLDALARLTPSMLERLLTLNLLHSERAQPPSPAAIQLGYFGRQALQNYTRQHGLGKEPKMKPWAWLEEFRQRLARGL